MTDRELIAMAAKAANIHWNRWDYERLRALKHMVTPSMMWNPLDDDGEALRLAVKLHLALLFPMRGDAFAQVGAGQVGSMTAAKHEPHDPDPYAATRRAIVRAAAEIGRTL